jgi:isocitrate dehydrogenase kinase/phosphatase
MSCDLCEHPDSPFYYQNCPECFPNDPVFIREQMEHENEIAQIGKNRKAMTADILKLQERQKTVDDILKLYENQNTTNAVILKRAENQKTIDADILKLVKRQHEMYVDIRKLENYVNTVICFLVGVFMFQVIIFVTR